MAQQDMQASQRALDLVDIYCKKQPSGRHVADLLQILFDVATSRQPSEEGAKAHGDLTAKASRVARSICSAKPKTLPPVVGFKKTLEGLQRIHEIARASAAEQGIASACALCLSRLILNIEATHASAVTELYRTSIKDFVYRKGSALNADFILPFLQRGLGWDLLTDVLEAIKSEKTVTAYRRIQAVGLLQALINAHVRVLCLCDSYNGADSECHQKTESDKMALALPRMIEALFHVLQQNDIAQSLNAPRTKEVLKTILAISRIAQSVSTPDLEKLQNQAQSYLEALTAQNGNPGLKNMVQQILSTSKTRGEKRKKGDASVPIKPKVNGSSNGDGAALPKKKKQKVTSTAT